MKNKIAFCIALLAAVSLISCAPTVKVDKTVEKELRTGVGGNEITYLPPEECQRHNEITVRDEEHHWGACQNCGTVLTEKEPHETVRTMESQRFFYFGGVKYKTVEEFCSCNRIVRTLYIPEV